jgi:UDP-N-acetylglucosamine transferase subunit ALG13
LTTLAKINNLPRKTPKILLAPLDWGLGHATRCIPIIKELINQECEVWIAASGDQKALLIEEFPFLRFVELPGYDVKYGKNRAFTLFKIFGAIPKILIRIKRENDWLKRFLVTGKLDAVISDNRYGLYAPGLYSVFITHQLRIQTPWGSWVDTLLQRIHYRAIRRFSICWVPDLEGAGSLAGILSHPGKLPAIPTHFIGLLSRLERPAAVAADRSGQGSPVEGSSPVERPVAMVEGAAATAAPASCDLLVLLSGPEPQRTIFEKKVLEQLASYSGSVVLVRGLPGSGALSILPGEIPAGVRVYNHLPARTLNVIINEAGIVLSRAGYSTIMDLLKLGKKAILVPTPGQTEQEYLGRHLSGKGIALCREQSTFSLAEALSGARDFPFIGIEGGRPAGIAAGGIPPAGSSPVGELPEGDDLLQNALRSLLENLDSSEPPVELGSC